MNILIFSDCHGNEKNIKQVLKKKFDFIICAGDANDYSDDAQRKCIDKSIIDKCTYYIQGNNDIIASCHDEWYKKYKVAYTSFTIGNKKIALMHSFYELKTQYPKIYEIRLEVLKKLKPDVLICGHSHVSQISYDKDLKFQIINPGSISYPRYPDKYPTYVVIDDLDKWEPRIISIKN